MKKISITDQVQKIKRDRKLAWIVGLIAIAFFSFTTWLNVNRAFVHFDIIANSSLPDDATPDIIRMLTLTDCIPLLLSLILITISLAAAGVFLLKLLLPDRKEKLLLALAEKSEEESQQINGEGPDMAGAKSGPSS